MKILMSMPTGRDALFLGFGTSVDSMQVQLYNGVVINKWQAQVQGLGIFPGLRSG